MFNLIKFEITKKLNLFKILGTVILLAQGFYIYKYSQRVSTDSIRENVDLATLGFVLVISFVAFTFSSISTFSKDINLENRSMVFMIPKSGFEIITSKFLAIFIYGFILVLISTLLFLGNLVFRDPNFLATLSSKININYFGFIILTITSFASFFALICLSIIITKTFLVKLKFKTLITIIVLFLLSKLFNLIFWNNLRRPQNIDFSTSISLGVSLIGVLIVTTLTLWICGWLIDNKTDL